MHELSMAANIMENVLAFAEDHHLGRVLQVHLAVGELTCIQPEQLKFCYESVTRETPLRNSTLEIEDVMARIRCRHCRYEGPPKYWVDDPADAPTPTLQCPKCEREADAILGDDCIIKTIQYAT